MILLVPGFGTGIFSKILPDRHHNGGFFGFDELLAQKEAVLFDWASVHHFTWWQSLNPWAYLAIYWRARKQISQPLYQKKLLAMIQELKPSTVICHSLGSELFWHTTKHSELPPSVKNIIFLQSDLPARIEWHDHSLGRDVRSNRRTFINTFSPFDLNLLFSTCLHLQPRAGLIGLRYPKIKNVFLPWLKNFNMHDAGLHGTFLLELLKQN
jgi:hypothetical protein